MTSTDTRTRPATGKTKTRAGKMPEERAAEVEALAERLTDVVAELTTSAAWVAMLRVAARFTRYSPNNALLLWMQSEQRGVTLPASQATERGRPSAVRWSRVPGRSR